MDPSIKEGFLSPRPKLSKTSKVKCCFRKLLPEVKSKTSVFNPVWSNTQTFYVSLASKSSRIRRFIWVFKAVGFSFSFHAEWKEAG